MSFSQFIKRAYHGSEAVQSKFQEVGLRPEDIHGPDDLVRIPLTHKAELASRQANQPPFGGFLAEPFSALQRVFVSPGPIYDPQGPGLDYWGWAEALECAGFVTGDIVQNTFSYHLTPAGMMFDGALRAMGCVVIPAGVGNSELQVRVMRDLGVTGYIGVPSFLYALLGKAEEIGLRCPGDLRLTKAWVTAEKLPEQLRRLLRERYGVQTFQGYGTADTGCVAYECQEQSGLHVAARAILDIVDPETGLSLPCGEAGEVVVTVIDDTYPLLRFGTGDLGIVAERTCSCGRSGRVLLGIYGRTSDGVKVRGLFVYPHQVRDLRERLGVRTPCRAVVRQVDFRDRLTVELELPGKIDGSDLEEKVKSLAKDILRLTVDVEAVKPGTIEDDKLLVDARHWR